MPDRTISAGDYRYGFNGKENDQNGEWGTQLVQDYGFRLYNPAIGKFLSVDPLAKIYPELTPFQFASNTPIQAIDLDGLEAAVAPRPGTRTARRRTVTSNAPPPPPVSGVRISPRQNLRETAVEYGAFTFQEQEYKPLTGFSNYYTKGTKYFEPIFNEDGSLNVMAEVGTFSYRLTGTAGYQLQLEPNDISLPKDLKIGPASVDIVPNELGRIELDGLRWAERKMNGNNHNNPNPHQVYEIFGMDESGKIHTIKYGINDMIGNPNRPGGQLTELRAKYSTSNNPLGVKLIAMSWTQLNVTRNRREALYYEQVYVDLYFSIFGRRPPEQILPKSTFE